MQKLVQQISEFKQVAHYFPIATAVFLVVLAEAVTGTYLALFAVERAQMSPLELGVFLSGIAISGIAVSVWLDRRFDLHPSRAPVFLTLVALVCGSVLLAVTTNYGWLILIGCVLLGPSAAARPQLFALAKKHLNKAGTMTSERGVVLLAAMDSTAWIVGPALGVGVISLSGFRGLFVASALCAALAIIILGLTHVDVPVATVSERPTKAVSRPPLRRVGFIAFSFTLFYMAMFVGSTALAIVVKRDLNGTNGDVGLIFSTCAVLQVVVMLGLAYLPRKVERHLLILLGFVVFVLYFGVSVLAPATWIFVVAQLLRALAIGLVSGLGINYFQALMPNQTGSATTLFTNTGQAGSILSGIAVGGWAQLFGYRSLFLLCAVLSGIGGLVLYVSHRSRLLNQ